MSVGHEKTDGAKAIRFLGMQLLWTGAKTRSGSVF
ncbi:hypothetical protein B23_1698 [Geobacillus thermoleovorans B23]|nr:hypothetical protein B23_1698 [Geobacillus thermoleovorans B23]